MSWLKEKIGTEKCIIAMLHCRIWAVSQPFLIFGVTAGIKLTTRECEQNAGPNESKTEGTVNSLVHFLESPGDF